MLNLVFCDKTDIIVVNCPNFVHKFHDEMLTLANSYGNYDIERAITEHGEKYGATPFMCDHAGKFYCFRFPSEKDKLLFLIKYAS